VTARHILIPIHDFSAGGTELIAFRLARLWLEAGRRVTILAGADDGPLRPRVPDGADIHVLSPARPRSATSRLFLGKQMAPDAVRLAPDAIFIPGNFHFGLARALKAALPRTAIVAKASNPIWSDGPIPAPLPLARAAVGAVTRGIDRIVAMADALEDEVARYVGHDRVTVIPDPFLDDATQFHARSGIPARPDETLRLLTVGRLEPQKDPMLAVAVLAVLRDRGVPAALTLLGAGPMEAQIRAQIARLDLGDRVSLPGYVTNPGQYYEAASLLLMTSRFEGVPAVIGEALSHGLPFVATRCSNWLAALAAGHPALGHVTADRQAATLADALLAQARYPYPTAEVIEEGIGPHRAGRAAAAYLDLFDRLAPRGD